MKATSWKAMAAAVAMVLGVTFQAQALTIVPGDAIESGDQTSNAAILTYLAGLGYDLNSLYKDNVGGVEEGPFAGSYETTYNPPADPEDFLITYVGGPIIGPPAYLLVKDGSQSPAWYFFDLTALGWNGTDDIEGLGFWPNQGAISHVEIFGTPTTVPDGGSMAMLLGLALMGLAGVRRFTA